MLGGGEAIEEDKVFDWLPRVFLDHQNREVLCRRASHYPLSQASLSNLQGARVVAKVRILLEEWEDHLVRPVDLHLNLVDKGLVSTSIQHDVGTLKDVEVVDLVGLSLKFGEGLFPSLHDGVVLTEEVVVVHCLIDNHLIVLLEGIDKALFTNVSPDYLCSQRPILSS
jgi:hypothetical protein